MNLSQFTAFRVKNYKYIQNAFLPKITTIPLSQEKDCICKPIVKVGDIVNEGDVIAEPELKEKDKAFIHSSVPGKVVNIISSLCPNGRIEKSIQIQFGGKFTYTGTKREKENISHYSESSIISSLVQNGIINTFDISKPVSLGEQIKKIGKDSINLVVRLFDEDTSRLTDILVSKFYSEQVVEGAKVLAKAIKAEKIILVGKKTSLVVENFRKWEDDFVCIKKIDATSAVTLLKRELIISCNKFRKTDSIKLNKNDFFIDSSTLVEVYNCILEKTPAVSKNVHFSGNCLTASCFLNVRIGQTIGDIVKQIGGFSKQPAKIIINGETYGNTVSSLNVPITKYVKSVLFISAEKKLDSIGYSCVNCGCCRDVCPVGLSPDLLYNHMVNNHKISDVYIKSSILCTECGLCNANCKSRLPLFQTIAVLKNQTEK